MPKFLSTPSITNTVSWSSERHIRCRLGKIIRGANKSFYNGNLTLDERVLDLPAVMEEFRKLRKVENRKSKRLWDLPVWDHVCAADSKWPYLCIRTKLVELFKRVVCSEDWAQIYSKATSPSETEFLARLCKHLGYKPEQIPLDFSSFRHLFTNESDAAGTQGRGNDKTLDELLYLRFALRHFGFLNARREGFVRLVRLAERLGNEHLNQELAKFLPEAGSLPQTRKQIEDLATQKKLHSYVRKHRKAKKEDQGQREDSRC